MYCFTFFSLVVVFVVSLICATPAESLRPYHRRRDLNGVRPVSDLGWKVPLQSGSHVLPLPAADKKLKYLTIGRGTMTYECKGGTYGNDQPTFHHQNTELYDVAPLAQNLPNEDALHDLVPRFCEYDYAELRNSSLTCVGRIYTEQPDTVVDLFGFNEPQFSIEVTWAIPSPAGQAVNGYWSHSATTDRKWEVYRVETAGGAAPTTCEGHENSMLEVAYAAEYWFYHK